MAKLTAEEWERKIAGIRATNRAFEALQAGHPELPEDDNESRVVEDFEETMERNEAREVSQYDLR